MPSGKTTVVIVPGSWHVSEHWQPIVDRLAKQNVRAVAINRPTVGGVGRGLDDDIDAARKAIETECSQGNDVVVVCHSAGGICASASFDGLIKGEHSEYSGGVIGMVAVTSFLPPAGLALKDMDAGPRDWQKFGDNMMHLRLDGDEPSAENALFWDCDEEDVAKAKAKLLPTAATTRMDVSTSYMGWDKVPLTFVMCELDRALLPYIQEAWVQKWGPTLGDEFTLRKLACGHSPFINKQQELTDLIVEAVDTYSGRKEGSKQ